MFKCNILPYALKGVVSQSKIAKNTKYQNLISKHTLIEANFTNRIALKGNFA